MKSLVAVIGTLLLFTGIVFEGVYITGAKPVISRITISPNASLVSGIVLIFVGLLFIFAALRIPRLQPVRE
ncbi:hypothetical protein E6H36_10560 [Candidatus Bathyarchaeota archaeon]|nr:MAG: hypothetical protein AUJ07_01505 [Crenarchaeota archaeon 13_1_40CM_3_53_5]TMI23378.1 MAG: hypothetical protein E6H36_10560 [Candidatus Bathyarchaeota archaeon]TMI32158.1 MAG: hypothetical protein E6H29_02635 [Candidatus Bathyarchaeota archaeon]